MEDFDSQMARQRGLRRQEEERRRREWWLENLYPVTIIADRYSGTYSGGRYVAFGLYADAIPEGATGGDIECAEFFASKDVIYGVGETPNEALENLIVRMRVAMGALSY